MTDDAQALIFDILTLSREYTKEKQDYEGDDVYRDVLPRLVVETIQKMRPLYDRLDLMREAESEPDADYEVAKTAFVSLTELLLTDLDTSATVQTNQTKGIHDDQD
jgi:hypothetical protein